MQLELENARDKWKQQCDEEVARRLAGKEEELVKKMEDKEEELVRKVKEAEEKVKSLWAADLAKLRQNFQVKKILKRAPNSCSSAENGQGEKGLDGDGG